MSEPSPRRHGLRGGSVAELADRPVPPRRAAIVTALTLLGLVAVARPLVYTLWDTANRVPRALAPLRDHANPTPDPEGISRPAVVVLVDGLRRDEARGMPALRRLRGRAASAVVELDGPTLSKPFYHAVLTGVPSRGSGVRTNRFDGRARLDSLADRVRAAGGRVAWITEGLDWFPEMHGRPSDLTRTDEDSLDATLDAVLERIASGEGPDLTLVHVVSVDEAGHEHGVHSAPRAQALEEANRVVARVAAILGENVVLAVLSDHGHVAPGGHGGDEPQVRRVPLLLRAPKLPSRRTERTVRVAQIAPTLARWMGVAPPRSTVATAVPALSPPNESPALAWRAKAANLRHRLLGEATRDERNALRARRTAAVPLCAFVLLCVLGATKRAFRGFDLGTAAAPVVAVALVAGGHTWILERPFTLSAMDEVNRHAIRLAMLGGVATLVAIAIGSIAARRLRSGVEPWRVHVRRSAVAVAFTAVASIVLCVAWVGGAVGPWPLSAHLLYAQVIAPACGAGAILASAGTLMTTAVRADP